jgi:hypothetical protein
VGATTSVLGEAGSVVLSLQPNQPGVLHVTVLVMLLLAVLSDEAVRDVVIVLSKQPHHPGVLQVVLVEDAVDRLIVGREPLLFSK